MIPANGNTILFGKTIDPTKRNGIVKITATHNSLRPPSTGQSKPI